jgi:hypothetical protein
VGWIVVEFVERREVFVGGASQGFNLTETGVERALRVGDGWQTVSLGGPLDFEPRAQRVDVPADSDAVSPFRVVFTRKV